MERVPVMCGVQCVELADPTRVSCLLAAPNVEAITRHRDGKLVELQLHDFGEDPNERAKRGISRAGAHDYETWTNPRGVWELNQ
jgi:hypothetical protein